MNRRIGAVLLWTTGLALPAQTPPSFELASIKPQPWTNEGGAGVSVRGNTLYAEHADLYMLVDFAWGLSPYNLQVSGGPEWARHGILSNVSGFDSVLFQVIARAPDGPQPSIEQFRMMLQTLLADRFQLRIHHATKSLAVFNLVVMNTGLKFKENLSDAKNSITYRSENPFRMTGTHAPLSVLVDELTYATGRPVIDKTGLAGFYDFEIAWSPRFLRDDLAGADEQTSDLPSVLSAVQRQLGLKLEPDTAPGDTVVIDHAEKPSAN
jgi:uncharacterized protein (TIGR03435 family)